MKSEKEIKDKIKKIHTCINCTVRNNCPQMADGYEGQLRILKWVLAK